MEEGLGRKLAILGIGIVVIAAVWLAPDKKSKKPRPKKAAPAAASPAPAAPAPGPKAADPAPVPASPAVNEKLPALSPELRAKQEAVLSEPCGRDPFSQYSKDRWKPEDLSLLELKGICSRRGSRPVALLGDSIVKEGDFVGKAQVMEIGRNFVRLKKGAREYKLVLEGAR